MGMVYGALLQRARFCFVSGLRDWFLFRSYRVATGIAAGLLTATIGFGVLSAVWLASEKDPTARLWVLPLGFNTLVGGVFFGFGMVMAGGCASGTLYRIGEGYAASLGALVAMVGAFPAGLWLRENSGWLKPTLPMGEAWLPRWIGLPGAALLTVGVCLALIALARASRGASYAPENETLRATSESPLQRPWPPLVAGTALGTLNILQTALDRPWGISEPLFWLAASGGELSEFMERALVRTRFSPLLLDVGIVLGALLCAVAAGEFAWRVPRLRRLSQAFAGGALMGLGIALAFGCNIGGFFSGIPSLSLTAWVYLAGLLAGVRLATKALRMG